jgi:hypothetical protein
LPLHALSGSASIYLREAANGPVRWQPWNASTLALARRLNRPILIDVGAVWCHWCHAMDQTTYADPEVANLINQHFVPIKVDSDQQPALDSYYQNAAARLSGAGGWPLTCFAMPSGALFLAFGYVPARSSGGAPSAGGLGMVKILTRVNEAFLFQRAALEEESAQRLAQLMQPAAGPAARRGSEGSLLSEILGGIRSGYDKTAGGFGSGAGPRFYDFPALELALSYGFSGHPDFTAMAIESLRKIAGGGVYDQLGGGFHRYSTDSRWRLPHFEKLLYDQAMSLECYSQAYEATGDDNLARVARGITNYVDRTLLDPNDHVFYAHQDADSFEGDDGSYYTWTKDEIAKALKSDEAAAAIDYFGIDRDPVRAPDGRIVLRRAIDTVQLAQRLHLSVGQARDLLNKAAAGLVAVRERRRKPSVDTAILVDRNALAAKAYLTAGAALHDPQQRRIALDDLEYLRTHARAPDGSYFHVASATRHGEPGGLSDQVYVLDALLAAYQSSGDQRYLGESKALAELIIRDYFDPRSGLLHERVESLAGTDLKNAPSGADAFFDHPMPAPQALMASAIQTLAVVDSKSKYAAVAAKLIAAGPEINPDAASMVATFGIALEHQIRQRTLIVITGNGRDARTAALREAALASYRPGKIVITVNQTNAATIHLPEAVETALAWGMRANAPAAFVCSASACANPVTTPGELVALVRRFQIASKQSFLSDRGPL